MDNLKQALANPATMPVGHKYWEDLNFDEKVERLMGVVGSLLQTINVQQQQLTRMDTELKDHQHDEEGVPFVKKFLDGNGNEKKTYIYDSGFGMSSSRVNQNPFNLKSLANENMAESASSF